MLHFRHKWVEEINVKDLNYTGGEGFLAIRRCADCPKKQGLNQYAAFDYSQFPSHWITISNKKYERLKTTVITSTTKVEGKTD